MVLRRPAELFQSAGGVCRPTRILTLHYTAIAYCLDHAKCLYDDDDDEDEDDGEYRCRRL